MTILQAEWKKVGPADRKAQKALWTRFSSACNDFFERRKAELGVRKRQWAENLKLKDALCVQAEELRTRDDLAASVEATKRLQAEWKKIGPVRRNKSDAIWERFRVACDGVFERVKEGEREAASEKIAAREALCAELESLLSHEPRLAVRVGIYLSNATSRLPSSFLAPVGPRRPKGGGLAYPKSQQILLPLPEPGFCGGAARPRSHWAETGSP